MPLNNPLEFRPLSIFPRKFAGQQPLLGRLEAAASYKSSATPAGDKSNVLFEARGEAGILQYIWLTLTATDAGPMEAVGYVQVFIDDEDTPVINLSINDFFQYAPTCDKFSTPLCGRTRREYAAGNYSSGAYRYLWAPFKRYCRVQYINGGIVNASIWGQAGALMLSQPLPDAEQRDYRIYSNEDATHAKQTPLTIVDIAGAGQLESIWLSVEETSGNPWLEGNIEIYVDSETRPSWVSTGGEDLANGAFYEMTVGGFPAGRAGLPTGVLDFTIYRWFVNDPITFNTHLKVVWWVGQPGQGDASWIDATVIASGFVGLWHPGTRAVSYIDKAALLVNEQFTGYAAADLPAPWTHPGGARWQGGGNKASFGDKAAFDIWALYPITPNDYWAQARVKIVEASADAEVFLRARGTATPWIAQCVQVGLKRVSQYEWLVIIKDAGEPVAHVNMGGGLDLLNQAVDLALKCNGAIITAYWKWPEQTRWQPVCRWTTALLTGDPAIAQWIANCEVDDFVVYALQTVTS